MNKEKESQYKHLQLRRYFVNMALHGRFNKALPSERELAAMFSVARGTVRASLNAMVQEKYLLRIPRRGYFVDPGGFPEVMRNKKVVGILVLGTTLAFYDEDELRYLQELAGLFADNDLLLQFIMPSDNNFLADVSSSNLDGMIWLGAEVNRFEKLVKECHVPVVGLFNYEKPSCGNYIFLNHYTESYQKMQHLILRGCRRVAVNSIDDNTLQGCIDALKDAGLPFDPALKCKLTDPEEMLRFYDTVHPDAFFINPGSYDALQFVIRKRHLSVPDQLQYIGGAFRDFAESTVSVKPYKQIALTLVKQIIQMMNGKKTRLVKEDFRWTIRQGKSTKTIQEDKTVPKHSHGLSVS